jgi:succinate dehydrogenase / fumarate reductase iron-sulfur subunit
MARDIILRIQRQDGPDAQPYKQEFRLTYKQGINIIACLQEIARNPVDARGERVVPPVWDCSCLEEVCGACSMLVNGRPMQSCSTLIDNLPDGPIELAPLSRYPVVRDLIVDRRPMFEALKRIEGWIHLDGTYDLGPAPRRSPEEQQVAYAFSRCMTCGCCMEACPQYDGHDPEQFIGPAPLGQAYYFGLNPTGKMHQGERLDALMGPGGITTCGNAQNCVEVCPKEIPLTEAIAQLNRQVNRKWWSELFGK